MLGGGRSGRPDVPYPYQLCEHLTQADDLTFFLGSAFLRGVMSSSGDDTEADEAVVATKETERRAFAAAIEEHVAALVDGERTGACPDRRALEPLLDVLDEDMRQLLVQACLMRPSDRGPFDRMTLEVARDHLLRRAKELRESTEAARQELLVHRGAQSSGPGGMPLPQAWREKASFPHMLAACVGIDQAQVHLLTKLDASGPSVESSGWYKLLELLLSLAARVMSPRHTLVDSATKGQAPGLLLRLGSMTLTSTRQELLARFLALLDGTIAKQLGYDEISQVYQGVSEHIRSLGLSSGRQTATIPADHCALLRQCARAFLESYASHLERRLVGGKPQITVSLRDYSKCSDPIMKQLLISTERTTAEWGRGSFATIVAARKAVEPKDVVRGSFAELHSHYPISGVAVGRGRDSYIEVHKDGDYHAKQKLLQVERQRLASYQQTAKQKEQVWGDLARLDNCEDNCESNARSSA